MSVGNLKDREILHFSATSARRGALRPPSDAFPWPTVALDVTTLTECLRVCRARRVGYRMGAKVTDWRQPMGEVSGGCMALDCSGFVGWALAVATGGALSRLCDLGSVQQHEWCAAVGFKPSTVDAAKRADGILRIAFLAPVPPSGRRRGHPGHVALVRGAPSNQDAETLESYGGHGPGARPWTGKGWQAEATVYVLTRPDGIQNAVL
jgi:hypothetical protein